LTENFDGEKKSLEFKLQSQYFKKEDLEGQVKDLTSLITDLNVTRNYLQLNYEEQEKVETDLLVEKKNISRKQQIKIAE
jgi:cell division protein FtsL